jgi:hypothetical protein
MSFRLDGPEQEYVCAQIVDFSSVLLVVVEKAEDVLLGEALAAA